jgi:hypothetical protein
MTPQMSLREWLGLIQVLQPLCVSYLVCSRALRTREILELLWFLVLLSKVLSLCSCIPGILLGFLYRLYSNVLIVRIQMRLFSQSCLYSFHHGKLLTI